MLKSTFQTNLSSSSHIGYTHTEIKNKNENIFYNVRIIYMRPNKLFMHKIIISDDCGDRGPTHFVKT